MEEGQKRGGNQESPFVKKWNKGVGKKKRKTNAATREDDRGKIWMD